MMVSKPLLEINGVTWEKMADTLLRHFWTGWGDGEDDGQTGLMLLTQHGGRTEQASRDLFLPRATLLGQITSTSVLFSLGHGREDGAWCSLSTESASRWIAYLSESWDESAMVRSWEVSICVRRCYMCTNVPIMCVYNVHLVFMYIFTYKCRHMHIDTHTMDFTMYSCEGKQKIRLLLNLFQGEKEQLY